MGTMSALSKNLSLASRTANWHIWFFTEMYRSQECRHSNSTEAVNLILLLQEEIFSLQCFNSLFAQYKNVTISKTRYLKMKNAILLYLKSLLNKQELFFTSWAHLIKGPVITFCPRVDDFRMEFFFFFYYRRGISNN